MIDVILSDLRSRYGEKLLLSPDDLVEVLGISVGQQANLRSQGRFPITTTKVGALVKVSIYDLAKYLSGLCVDAVKHEVKATQKTQDKAQTRIQKKKQTGHLQGKWWFSQQFNINAVLDKRLYDFKASANRNIEI